MRMQLTHAPDLAFPLPIDLLRRPRTGMHGRGTHLARAYSRKRVRRRGGEVCRGRYGISFSVKT